ESEAAGRGSGGPAPTFAFEGSAERRSPDVAPLGALLPERPRPAAVRLALAARHAVGKRTADGVIADADEHPARLEPPHRRRQPVRRVDRELPPADPVVAVREQADDLPRRPVLAAVPREEQRASLALLDDRRLAATAAADEVKAVHVRRGRCRGRERPEDDRADRHRSDTSSLHRAKESRALEVASSAGEDGPSSQSPRPRWQLLPDRGARI